MQGLEHTGFSKYFHVNRLKNIVRLYEVWRYISHIKPFIICYKTIIITFKIIIKSIQVTDATKDKDKDKTEWSGSEDGDTPVYLLTIVIDSEALATLKFWKHNKYSCWTIQKSTTEKHVLDTDV